MAQLNSASFTNFIATPKVSPRSREWGGRVRVFSETFVANQGGTTTAAGDCVRMFRVPANHKVIGGRALWIALGAGSSITVGDFFDCDRFLSSTFTASSSETLSASIGGCGVFNRVSTGFNASTNTPDVGPNYLFTCDTDILLVFGYGGTPTGLVTVVLETVVEG